MRVIILGFRNCPHCRALIRLLKEAKDITSVSYIEFNEFVESFLSESDKELYIKKLRSEAIPLPYILYKDSDDKWSQLDVSRYTKNILESYVKTIKNVK